MNRIRKEKYTVDWQPKKMYKCQIYHMPVTFGWQFKKIYSLVSTQGAPGSDRNPHPNPHHLICLHLFKSNFLFLFFFCRSHFLLLMIALRGNWDAVGENENFIPSLAFVLLSRFGRYTSTIHTTNTKSSTSCWHPANIAPKTGYRIQ